ncbi:MAG: ABC transporter permease [Rickettsiaceae bacterium]
MKSDLSVAIKYFDLYYFLAKQDLKSRFRRSYLGISWIVIQQLFFSLVAGFVWSKIFGMKTSEFIPFLTIGSVLWTFMSAAMVEGCDTFVIAHHYLKQLPLPQSIFIFRTLFTSLFYLAVGLCTAIGVLMIFDKFNVGSIFYMLPGILILICYFYGVSGSLAYLGLRYRDLQHAITSILALLFIITPVLYPPEILIKKGIGIVVYINPLASLIEIIRHPLLSNDFAPSRHYLISLTFVFIMILFKLILKKNWERFVAFWA